ncbi:MAG: cell division protein CrgA [Acidimicrobiia bacterium]|nr:cell division protein CrgA [Acidimicrobiia bacterium]
MALEGYRHRTGGSLRPMSRPPKRKVAGTENRAAGGRTTPKSDDEGPTRYTPPTPRSQKVSPMWVPVLMFTLFGLGGAVIVLNYLGLLPGAASNWYLLVGLGLILGGIITATNFH